MSLELQRCGIRCVGKLVDMLPELVHKTKRFNLEGNDLSAKNVRKLVDAMTAAYAYIRPSWLSIGPDAQAAAATCFTKTLCHPHHPRGCLCLKPGVAHVVRTLPKYDAVARAARWNHISAGLLMDDCGETGTTSPLERDQDGRDLEPHQRPGLRGWTTGRRRFRR